MCIVGNLPDKDDDGVELLFVIGKCKIAPMKRQMIHKLEFKTALYSVKMRQLITEYQDI